MTAKTLRHSRRQAFTLLEVIAAVALLAIAAAGIAQGQSGAVRNVVQSEKMSQAMSLAQQKMTELELEVRKKNFEAFEEDASGDFDDEKLKEFRWNRKLEKVDTSCFFPQAGNSGGGESGAQSSGIPDSILDIFSQAVRKVVVTIEWNDGPQIRKIQLAQIYVRYESLPQL